MLVSVFFRSKEKTASTAENVLARKGLSKLSILGGNPFRQCFTGWSADGIWLRLGMKRITRREEKKKQQQLQGISAGSTSSSVHYAMCANIKGRELCVVDLVACKTATKVNSECDKPWWSAWSQWMTTLRFDVNLARAKKKISRNLTQEKHPTVNVVGHSGDACAKDAVDFSWKKPTGAGHGQRCWRSAFSGQTRFGDEYREICGWENSARKNISRSVCLRIVGNGKIKFGRNVSYRQLFRKRKTTWYLNIFLCLSCTNMWSKINEIILYFVFTLKTINFQWFKANYSIEQKK